MPVSEKTAIRRSERKKLILQAIRQTPNASRTVVKELCGLSMDSALSLVEELLAEGLIVPCGQSAGGRAGRRATFLKINPAGCYFLGLRYNAGEINGVAMDFDQQPVCQESLTLPLGATGEQVMAGLYGVAEALLGRLGERARRVRGIGIGSPGIIDPEKGVVRRYVHIPQWREVPLKALMAQRLGLPVYVEHGVKCAARAMMGLPDYAGAQSLVFAQVGRGISLCLMLEGEIYRGVSYLSGEVGHVFAEANGITCECGRQGCLETVAAEGALLRKAREGQAAGGFACLAGKEPTLAGLLQGESCGDGDCRALLARAGEYLGRALADCVTLLNPSHLVACGPLAASPAWREGVNSALGARCLPESLAALQVSYTHPQGAFYALGAARLPYHQQFAPALRGGGLKESDSLL